MTCNNLIIIKLWRHCGKCQTNRCQDLNSLSLGELKETTRMPSYYVNEDIQQDPKSNNLSPNEAIDVAQNRSLWRLMSMFGAMHS